MVGYEDLEKDDAEKREENQEEWLPFETRNNP